MAKCRAAEEAAGVVAPAAPAEAHPAALRLRAAKSASSSSGAEEASTAPRPASFQNQLCDAYDGALGGCSSELRGRMPHRGSCNALLGARGGASGSFSKKAAAAGSSAKQLVPASPTRSAAEKVGRRSVGFEGSSSLTAAAEKQRTSAAGSSSGLDSRRSHLDA